MAEKIVLIGAGSMEFTPALIARFLSRPRYADACFALVDTDAQRLARMKSVIQKYIAAKGLAATVEASGDRRQLLLGADMVIVAIATGGMETLKTELDIPAKYGYIQHGGDTVGPSGIVRALRHIPPMVDIGRDVQALCPTARFYNLTNPLTAITGAVRRYTGANCIGLCMGSVHTAEYMCRTIGEDFTKVAYTVAGINHCTWVLEMTRDGRDLYPELAKAAAAVDHSRSCHDTPPRADGFEVPELCLALYSKFGLFPGPGDGHISEFFPQFIQGSAAMRLKYAGFDRHLLKWMLKTQTDFAEKAEKMAVGALPFDADMFDKAITHGDTQIIDIEAALAGDGTAVVNMNVPNGDSIPNMPARAIVEIPVEVDRDGLKPRAVGKLPAAIVPVLAAMSANYELVAEAAMEGSREKAVQAFLNDPTCTDPVVGERCILEMIEAEKAALPSFA